LTNTFDQICTQSLVTGLSGRKQRWQQLLLCGMLGCASGSKHGPACTLSGNDNSIAAKKGIANEW
jgi:hypothetical protein